MQSKILSGRLSAAVLSAALLGLGTAIAGCASQGPGDYRQTRMQACLAAAKTKSEKNDCYYQNSQSNGR